MKGDFTRSSFQPARRYSGVRMQQGRVQLDADWNEQIDIVMHQIRSPLADVLGCRATAAAPADGDEHRGFEIALPASNSSDNANDGEQQPELPDFSIGAGRCYVNGILCENDADLAFSAQPDFPGAAEQLRLMRERSHGDLLVYLDVWTRHMTALEDPDLRELALDGPDTTTRTKTVWQVKLKPYPGSDDDAKTQPDPESAITPRGTLNVQLADGRMRENQLYRVEVQRVVGNHLFFKWSRENGSVAYAIECVESLPSPAGVAADVQESAAAPQPNQAERDASAADGDAQTTSDRGYLISLLDHDPSNLHLAVDDWVEFVSDPITLDNAPQPLLRVTDVQLDTGKITVQARSGDFYFGVGQGKDAGLPDKAVLAAQHAYLRRWDQRGLPDGNVEGCVRASLDDSQSNAFIQLESGLSVQFAIGHDYVVGDYWMIPTRVQFSNDDPGLLWPTDADGAYLPQPSQGAERQAAPLARLRLVDGAWTSRPWEESDFESLPTVTAGLRDLTVRVADVEEDVVDLQQRVTVLEEKMEEVLAWMKIERTMLFEDFYSDEQLTAGEVVALDPHRHDYIVRADTHQERVFLGVVTDFPMEYYADPNRFRVAMSGRATCRVVGMVKAGALLIPSNYPGHAVAAGLYIRPGTVIGRALTGFTPTGSNKIGEVNILITMG